MYRSRYTQRAGRPGATNIIIGLAVSPGRRIMIPAWAGPDSDSEQSQPPAKPPAPVGWALPGLHSRRAESELRL